MKKQYENLIFSLGIIFNIMNKEIKSPLIVNTWKKNRLNRQHGLVLKIFFN